eukprot:6279941-Ditylum_brightwellii.AAC.1
MTEVQKVNTLGLQIVEPSSNDKPMPGALSIGGTAIKVDDLPLIEINMSDHLFFDNVPVKFTIPLPPKGRALGIEAME